MVFSAVVPLFANRSEAFTSPPFTCENEGWGEFEMHIDLYYTEKSGKISIPHDLNFQQTRYEETHVITFKNPSQSLQQILRETGPLPSDEDRKARKVDGGSKKSKKPFDVEKMADAMVKLEEEDLLQVIQLIHDHKSDDTFVQNNLDGESSMRGGPHKPVTVQNALTADPFKPASSRLTSTRFRTTWAR